MTEPSHSIVPLETYRSSLNAFASRLRVYYDSLATHSQMRAAMQALLALVDTGIHSGHIDKNFRRTPSYNILKQISGPHGSDPIMVDAYRNQLLTSGHKTQLSKLIFNVVEELETDVRALITTIEVAFRTLSQEESLSNNTATEVDEPAVRLTNISIASSAA